MSIFSHSINSFVNSDTPINATSTPVWLSVWDRFPNGGVIHIDAGILVPAGTPVSVVFETGETTILKASQAGSVRCTGFTENDVYSDSDGVASVTIVTGGIMLSDRVDPDSLYFISHVPGVTTCDEDLDGGSPITGLQLPQSSAESPIQSGSTVRIKGVGFDDSDSIVVSKEGKETPVSGFALTSDGVQFTAPAVNGEHSVLLKRAGDKFTLGTIFFNVRVSSVSLNKSSLSLAVGSSETLTATVSPETAGNKNVTWMSDHPEIASVNNGKVTAVKVGSATITVTTVDGRKTATCAVTVTPVKVTGVTLNKTTTSIVKGNTEKLTATVAPSNATDKTVSWTSDHPEFATVENGTVTAVAAGSAVITVTTTDGKKTATCTVTVTDA